jgi:hypothetical protein
MLPALLATITLLARPLPITVKVFYYFSDKTFAGLQAKVFFIRKMSWKVR